MVAGGQDAGADVYQIVPHLGGAVMLKGSGVSTFVAHNISKELVPISGTGPWQLAFGADGMAYIHNGLCSLWVEDILSIGCYQKNGSFFVLPAGETSPVPIENYGRRGDLSAAFEIAHRRGRRTLSFRCALWEQRRSGLRVWWDLSTIHNACGLAAFSTYGRWAAHGWKRWSRFCQETLKLPEEHTRKALGRSSDEEDQQYADFRSLSSVALLGLMTRWGTCSAPGGGLKNNSDREACMEVCEVLVGCACGEAKHSRTIFEQPIGEADEWGFFRGSRAHEVHIIGGVLHLGTLASAPSLRRAANGRAGRTFDMTGGVVIAEILALAASCAKLNWLTKQLVWWLGSLLDDFVVLKCIGSSTKLCDMSFDASNRALTKYYFGMRQAFSDQLFLSMGVDCGRVGKKNLWMGLVGCPNNTAAVLPPMDLRCPILGIRIGFRVQFWSGFWAFFGRIFSCGGMLFLVKHGILHTPTPPESCPIWVGFLIVSFRISIRFGPEPGSIWAGACPPPPLWASRLGVLCVLAPLCPFDLPSSSSGPNPLADHRASA